MIKGADNGAAADGNTEAWCNLNRCRCGKSLINKACMKAMFD